MSCCWVMPKMTPKNDCTLSYCLRSTKNIIINKKALASAIMR